jgi:SAM-dependent methyltransferase
MGYGMVSLSAATKTIARGVLPDFVYKLTKRLRRGPRYVPDVGDVRFGDLRRLKPISRSYGYDRGRPIDRYYIENFLLSESGFITGRVLEIGENVYTRQFGTNVTKSDVLHVHEGVEGTTYVDDLTDGNTLPDSAFDCVIVTQTLHLIFDMKAALQTIYRILKPGGVLLCTVPGITQISDEDWNDSWYWGLTTNSAAKLAGQVFPASCVEVRSYGNVLSAIAFLQGLAEREIAREELDVVDREYQVTVALKATKPAADFKVPMSDRWDYANREQFAYGDDTSYRRGIAFLDGRGTIEDWGCGTGYAKRYVKASRYIGVDGTDSLHCDVKADLQDYHSATECLFMRHVLEHNWGWRSILHNAVESFGHRMVLVIFTPFRDNEVNIGDTDGIPDLSLVREEILQFFAGMSVTEETIFSGTQYGEETLFYVEKGVPSE